MTIVFLGALKLCSTASVAWFMLGHFEKWQIDLNKICHELNNNVTNNKAFVLLHEQEARAKMQLSYCQTLIYFRQQVFICVFNKLPYLKQVEVLF